MLNAMLSIGVKVKVNHSIKKYITDEILYFF